MAANASETLLQVLDSDQVQQRIAGNENGGESTGQLKAAHVGFEKLNFAARRESLGPRGLEHGSGQIGANNLDSSLCDGHGQAARSAPQFQHRPAASPRFV